MADDDDRVAEAQEGIDLVGDLTGADSAARTRDRELAQARIRLVRLEDQRREEQRREERADWRDRDPQGLAERLAEIDSEIAIVQTRIRSLEQPDDRTNPDEVRHDVELLAGLGAGTTSATEQLARDRRRQAAAEARAQREAAPPADQPKRHGCTIPIAAAGVAAVIAVILVLMGLGDDDGPPVPDDLVADEATTATTSAPPVGQPLTSGAPVRYEGSSGGQIGCIPCDGQNRYISIERSDTAVGNSALAGQELVWPQGGQVTDFGVTIGGPNRGRYGVNLFVNGEYSVGCALETGQTSCTMQMDPAQLRQGDRVAIIVGEQGTVDANGVPLERGEFVLEWYFVFEPA